MKRTTQEKEAARRNLAATLKFELALPESAAAKLADKMQSEMEAFMEKAPRTPEEQAVWEKENEWMLRAAQEGR